MSSSNQDRETEKLRIMRAASTQGAYRHSIGGAVKTAKAPKPVTLPKMPWSNEDGD